MQTITLNVEDEAVDKVLSMLESVADEVEISSSTLNKKEQSIHKRQAGLLKGCVAPPEFYEPLD